MCMPTVLINNAEHNSIALYRKYFKQPDVFFFFFKFNTNVEVLNISISVKTPRRIATQYSKLGAAKCRPCSDKDTAK